MWKSENGYEVEFTDYFKNGKPSQYWLSGFDGNIGTGEAQSLKIPNRDGTVTYGLTRSARDIHLEGAIVSRSDKEKTSRQRMIENRDYIARCFDPKYFGTLYYYTYKDDQGRKIRCRPTGFPAIEQDSGISTNFAVGFVSDESFWSAAEPIGATMGASVKAFNFTHYLFPSSVGFILTRAVVDNPTLYNIEPRFEVYGNENAIEIHNMATGAFLLFRQPIADGERIIIDVRLRRAWIEDLDDSVTPPRWIFRENVINRLSMKSKIQNMLIVPGENEFTIKKQFPENKTTLIIRGDVPVMGV